MSKLYRSWSFPHVSTNAITSLLRFYLVACQSFTLGLYCMQSFPCDSIGSVDRAVGGNRLYWVSGVCCILESPFVSFVFIIVFFVIFPKSTQILEDRATRRGLALITYPSKKHLACTTNK
jgi:hypothetical protein